MQEAASGDLVLRVCFFLGIRAYCLVLIETKNQRAFFPNAIYVLSLYVKNVHTIFI